jgi:hypothetical protein
MRGSPRGWCVAIAIAVASVGCSDLLGVDRFSDASDRPIPEDIDPPPGEGGGAGAGGEGSAGAPVAAWVRSYGALERDRGQHLARTDDGELVLAGTIRGRVDFGGGPIGSPLGEERMFVARLDASGDHVAGIASQGNALVELTGVAVDAAGNLIVAGSFASGTLSLSAEGAEHDADPDGLPDAFLAKTSAKGDELWSHAFSSPEEQRWLAMAVSQDDGDIVVVGALRGTIELDGRPLASDGGEDVICARFGSDGDLEWAARFGDGGAQRATAVTFDAQGKVWIAGTFNGALDLGSHDLASTGNDDAFIARLDADGTPEAAARYGEGAWHQVSALAATAEGPVMVGSFAGATSFGGTTLTSAGAPDNRAEDIFVVALADDLRLRWHEIIGGASADRGRSLAVSDDGELLLGASFTGNVELGGRIHNSYGDEDALVVQLGPEGELRWSRSFGRGEADGVFATAFDRAGSAICAGSFRDAFQLGDEITSSNGEDDIFVALLSGAR